MPISTFQEIDAVPFGNNRLNVNGVAKEGEPMNCEPAFFIEYSDAGVCPEFGPGVAGI